MSVTQEAVAAAVHQPPSLNGTNTLLIGPTGTGKTHALRTLAEAGLEVFVIFTEPFMDVLSDIPDEKCHWHYIPPAHTSWDILLQNATTINNMNYEQLSKLKSGLNKQAYGQFKEILTTLANFKCDRCGQEFGPVDTWDQSRAIALDSLSGLNVMSKDLMTGAKPTIAQGEWGVAMDNLERLINKLCADTDCFFVLTGHVEREHDEVSGATNIMVSTLGRKLAPKLPRFFHDVVYTDRNATNFSWSTAKMQTDLKAKMLPVADNLQPSFVQIVEAWKKRGGVLPTSTDQEKVQ